MHTVCSPGLIFVLDDNLAESSGKSMTIVIYDCLADMQSSLTHKVLQLLPSTMRWNLLLVSLRPRSSDTRTYTLQKDNKLIVGSARPGATFITTEKRHGCGSVKLCTISKRQMGASVKGYKRIDADGRYSTL